VKNGTMTLLLILSWTFSSVGLSEDVKANKTVDTVIEFFKKHHNEFSSKPLECFSFEQEKDKSDKQNEFFVAREIHNSQCGGDTQTAPAFMRLKLQDDKFLILNPLSNEYEAYKEKYDTSLFIEKANPEDSVGGECTQFIGFHPSQDLLVKVCTLRPIKIDKRQYRVLQGDGVSIYFTAPDGNNHKLLDEGGFGSNTFKINFKEREIDLVEELEILGTDLSSTDGKDIYVPFKKLTVSCQNSLCSVSKAKCILDDSFRTLTKKIKLPTKAELDALAKKLKSKEVALGEYSHYNYLALLRALAGEKKSFDSIPSTNGAAYTEIQGTFHETLDEAKKLKCKSL
jgi:hypothetical protein